MSTRIYPIFRDLWKENFHFCSNGQINAIHDCGFKMEIQAKIVRQQKKTFHELNGELLSIPARSSDINPIENIFHIVREELQKEAFVLNVTHETSEDFPKRVCNTIRSISVQCIDSIIDTMDKRMEMIMNRKARRIKY